MFNLDSVEVTFVYISALMKNYKTYIVAVFDCNKISMSPAFPSPQQQSGENQHCVFSSHLILNNLITAVTFQQEFTMEIVGSLHSFIFSKAVHGVLIGTNILQQVMLYCLACLQNLLSFVDVINSIKLILLSTEWSKHNISCYFQVEKQKNPSRFD